MQFFALLRRRTEDFTEEQFAALLDTEAARVRALYAAGTVREAFSRGDVPGAILQIEAAGETEARTALATLPFLQHGMTEIEAFVPLRPYRGFV